MRIVVWFVWFLKFVWIAFIVGEYIEDFSSSLAVVCGKNRRVYVHEPFILLRVKAQYIPLNVK